MAIGATSDPGVSHDNSGWCSGSPSNQAMRRWRLTFCNPFLRLPQTTRGEWTGRL